MKIDPLKLSNLLNEGLSPAECGRRLGVNRSSVIRAIRQGVVGTTRVVIKNQAVFEKVVRGRLDLQQQILEVNGDALSLHRELVKYLKGEKQSGKGLHRFGNNPQILAINIMRELRSQWEFYMDVSRLLYGLEEAQRYGEALEDLFEEMAPEVKEEFRRILIKKHSLFTEWDPNLAGSGGVGN